MVVANFSLTGVDNIVNNLTILTRNIRDRSLKKAMAKVIDPIHRAALARVSIDTGTLSKAVQKKITSSGSKGEKVMGFVGIRRGIKVPVRVVTRGKHKGKLYMLVPTRYAHLIEFGHRIVVSKIWEVNPKSKFGRLREIKHLAAGSVVGFVRGKPFMRPAWDKHGKDVALKTFLVTLDRELASEVSKLNIR